MPYSIKMIELTVRIMSGSRGPITIIISVRIHDRTSTIVDREMLLINVV